MTAPFAGRTTRNFRQDHRTDGGCLPNRMGYCPCPLETAPAESADLVCSDVGDGTHLPVIDLDLPASLVPSGTPGHFHLYIDKAVSWADYVNVLTSLADAGIVQWGFRDATVERGFGSVRHPARPKVITEEPF